MLERRSALSRHPLIRPGTTLGVEAGAAPRVVIAERRPLALLQVSAFAAATEDAAARLSTALGLPLPPPNRFSGDAERNVRAIGPGVWQAIAAAGALPSAKDLREMLAGVATVVDLSHARTAVRVSGEGAARALAKHCGLDLDASVFPGGSATNARFGHLGATLACLDRDRPDGPAFEVLVFRGYAEFVFEALVEGAAEFGVLIAAG
jgi:heterotetrameric sarcosine oxidase gamma subunit